MTDNRSTEIDITDPATVKLLSPHEQLELDLADPLTASFDGIVEYNFPDITDPSTVKLLSPHEQLELDLADPETIVLTDNEPVNERTVAFFADPLAAQLLLVETVVKLIEAKSIKRGLVDLSTLPGLAIAAGFERAGVPYEAIEFGQKGHFNPEVVDRDRVQRPYLASDAEYFRALATGVKEIVFADIADIDANIVLVPAMAGTNGAHLNFSTGSLLGAVFTQLEEASLDIMFIDTPERGLRVLPDGNYGRTLIHVAGAESGA